MQVSPCSLKSVRFWQLSLLNQGTKAGDLHCKDKMMKGKQWISDPDSCSFITDRKAMTSHFPVIQGCDAKAPPGKVPNGSGYPLLKVAGQSQRAGTHSTQCNGSSLQAQPTDNRIKVRETHGLTFLCFLVTYFKCGHIQDHSQDNELSVERTVPGWGTRCLSELYFALSKRLSTPEQGGNSRVGEDLHCCFHERGEVTVVKA